jgi:RNA polymerase sigma factor (sigma-70 family)
VTVDKSEALRAAIGELRKARSSEGAWGAIYRALAPMAKGIAFRMLRGDRDAAQDVVHDAFIALYRAADFDRLTSSEDLTNYFAAMVRNKALDVLRAATSRRTVQISPGTEPVADEELLTEGFDTRADNSPSSEQLTGVGQALAEAVKGLSKPDRVLLALLMQGYSSSEVATRLGLTYSAAGVRIHRLRDRLGELRHILSN